MSEWTLEFGCDEPARVGELMREVVDGQMGARLSASQRAAAAWYRANGDRERAHTTGVFLKRPRVAGAAPILGVYVDSHAMATDFGVNKELYLARLANIGFAVSGIEFLPSRRDYRAPQRTTRPVREEPEELPALTPAEQLHVHELTAGLPENLQASASKAITLSLQREKLEKSKKRKQREI